MKAFETYCLYMSIKLHFESKTYDAIKYRYKTSVKEQSFWKKKDCYYFEKIGKRFNTETELRNFFIAYIICDKKWIGEMIAEESIWNDWQRRNASPLYTFETDLSSLNLDSFNDLFKRRSIYPEIIYRYLRSEVSIETIVILNQLTNFLIKEGKTINDSILWPQIVLKIQKYGAFVEFDASKAKKIILKLFTS